MRVLKFGGTSLADAKKFIHVTTIVAAQVAQEQVALVLSAPAGITNLLVKIVDGAAERQDISTHWQQITQQFSDLIAALAQAQPAIDKPHLQQTLDDELTLAWQRAQAINLLRQCPDNIYASMLSLGERLSVAIMQALLQAQGYLVSIIDATASLVAIGDFKESSVDIAASTQRILALNIPPQHIILMAGFSAGNAQGETVLLGRNGSDYSAAVLAACLQASCCEIWTDVDGVFTCDPRQAPDAHLLSELSYQEAMELSYFGAKVLHPRTIVPIAQFQIPCLIKNTTNPQAPGTLIHGSSGHSDLPVKGITSLEHMVMFNVSGPGMKGMVGMAARVFAAMSQANISVVLISQSSSEYSICFCVPEIEQRYAHQALEDEFYFELKEEALEPIEALGSLAIISVVGDGMRTQSGISASLFAALASVRINVVAIAQGSSERSISIVINNQDVVTGIRVIHQILFATEQIIELFLVGCGGVGGALLQQIHRQQQRLQQRHIDLRVYGIISSKSMLIDLAGIDLTHWQRALDQTGQTVDLAALTRLAKKHHLLNPVIVDCTASQEVADHYVPFLVEGFHVVTANKRANTGDQDQYQRLRQAAMQSRRKFLYEANVGAGLPVIENLQNLLNAGDELIRFAGVLSGSLSFIFGLLDEGIAFSAATQMARERGFTEPDPRDDLSGMDVARKLLILARESGYELELSDIIIEPILPAALTQLTDIEQFMSHLVDLDASFATRVSQAQSRGCVLRLVGTIENKQCRVGVEEIARDNPLAGIKNGENALAFYSRYYSPIPLVLRGYGAGNEVTAAGVFADLLRTLPWKLWN